VFYTSNNVKLQINGNYIVASNAQISLEANIQPNYNLKQRHTPNFAASNGIGGKLDFNYYLTGEDYFKKFITGQGESPLSTSQVISGNFGGLNFKSGYLTSYSINFTPNSPAVASASINFFDQMSGEFEPTVEESLAAVNSNVLNFKDATFGHYIPITQTEFSGTVEEFVEGTYNYSAEVTPVYLMNETKPSAVSFGPKTVNMNFETDNPTGYLPVSGNTARLSVDLKDSNGTTVDNFTCSGLLKGRNLSTAVGDYIKQTINVTQADNFDVNVYVGAILDSYGDEGCIGIGTT